MTTNMPLFPLETVLFPGMVMPLHIFEPRYLKMVNHCVDNQCQFGVVLIEEGSEAGSHAKPYTVGTAARISKVNHLPDGRMDITIAGTHRFRIQELDHGRPVLTGTTCAFPMVNASTRLAEQMARQVRPKVLEYVDLLSDASNTRLRLDRLPDDPKALSILVAIALQVSNEEKQRLLEIPGIPEILDRERFLLSLETMLIRHMVATQKEVERMGMGSTGYIFPN
ncbi:MAG: LON peptidase substrate-binding domain-containing protein [Caldilineaceae bacterium]